LLSLFNHIAVLRHMKKTCMIILLFQSMSLAAVDLSDPLNRALERDLQLQRLVLALENE